MVFGVREVGENEGKEEGKTGQTYRNTLFLIPYDDFPDFVHFFLALLDAKEFGEFACGAFGGFFWLFISLLGIF